MDAGKVIAIQYDLVVVGAGPAGATCARKAAQSGLDVLLIDKAEFPRPKPCGGGISPNVQKLLDFDLSPVIERRITDAVVYSPKGKKIHCLLSNTAGFTTLREKFDHFLLEKAEEAGVTVIVGKKAVAVEQIRRGIRVLCEGDSFKGQMLVGADGVNSIIARTTNLREKWRPEQVALCLTAEVQMNPTEVERITEGEHGRPAIELYFLIEGGFGWCFPKKRSISIGIGCASSFAKSLHKKWRQFVLQFEEQKEIQLNFSRETAFRVPLGPPTGPLITRRCILVGDAAGLASPITGEGIYYAISSGKMAADTVAKASKLQDPKVIFEYEKRIGQLISELTIARSIARRVFGSLCKTEIVCDIALNDPVMKELIVQFLIGHRAAKKIQREIIKRTLLHHPIKALKLMRG